MVSMYDIHCIHFFVEGYLDCFQLAAIKNNAAINIVDHISLLYIAASFGYMPRSCIAGSSDSTLSNFLRNCQTDFQVSCNI